jgi:serine/threonine protein kinase
MVEGLLYGQEVDWWALGVIIYTMMVGHYPFKSKDTNKLELKIKFNGVKYPEWISIEAEMIMRDVSTITIKTDSLRVLE